MGYCTQYHYCNSSSYRVSLTTTPATYPPPRSAFWKGAKPRDILIEVWFLQRVGCNQLLIYVKIDYKAVVYVPLSLLVVG